MNSFQVEISPDDMNFKSAAHEDRIGFVRKVLGIVGVQLLITAICTGFAISSPSFLEFAQESWGVLVLTTFLALFTSIALICSKPLSRTVPYNYLVLLVFTLCESYGVAAVSAMYETEDVIAAAVYAGVLTIALVGFSFYCVDYEMMKFLGVSMLTIVVLMILDLFIGFGNNKMYLAFGLLIYGIYLVIDIQRLLDESRFGMTFDDYIVGAMLVYLDIIMIFIKILQLIGKKK